MDTITLDNLIVAGIHGRTGSEVDTPQRFSITIHIGTDLEKAAATDNLLDTFDYKLAEKIAREVIAGPSRVLIEKIADTIADKILEHEKVGNVAVTVKKLDVFGGLEPSVTRTKTKK